MSRDAYIERTKMANPQILPEQIQGHMSMLDSMLKLWSEESGIDPDEYYARAIADIDNSVGEGLRQAEDTSNRIPGNLLSEDAPVRAEKLLSMEPIEIDSLPLGPLTDKKALWANALKTYLTFKPVQNVSDGRLIQFPRSGFNKTRSHGADTTLARVMQDLPKIVEKGEPLFTRQTGSREIKAWHDYGAKIVLEDGSSYFVRITVREEPGTKNFYYDSHITLPEHIEKTLTSGVSSQAMDGLTDQNLSKDILLRWLEEVNRQKNQDLIDPNILRQDMLGNATRMDDGRWNLSYSKFANLSTIIHEPDHAFWGFAPDQDKATATNWLRKTYNYDLPDNWMELDYMTDATLRDSWEKLARARERYHREGVIPQGATKKLTKVFERMKQWLTNIYLEIKGSQIDVELSPEMRRMYDEWAMGKRYEDDPVQVAANRVEEILYPEEPAILPTIDGVKVEPQVFTDDITGRVYTSDDVAYSREYNLSKGKAALDEAISGHKDINNAFKRAEIGQIDLVWGTPGNPEKNYKGGSGLSHIIARRNLEGNDGEVFARNIYQIIADGNVRSDQKFKDSGRIYIENGDVEIVISSNFNGNKKNWIVTGYYKKSPGATGEVYGSSSATLDAVGRFGRNKGAGIESSVAQSAAKNKTPEKVIRYGYTRSQIDYIAGKINSYMDDWLSKKQSLNVRGELVIDVPDGGRIAIKDERIPAIYKLLLKKDMPRLDEFSQEVNISWDKKGGGGGIRHIGLYEKYREELAAIRLYGGLDKAIEVIKKQIPEENTNKLLYNLEYWKSNDGMVGMVSAEEMAKDAKNMMPNLFQEMEPGERLPEASVPIGTVDSLVEMPKSTVLREGYQNIIAPMLDTMESELTRNFSPDTGINLDNLPEEAINGLLLAL